MQNKFSVIIPTFNRRQQLLRCLHSLIVQTYRNFEVIVVVDGSNDGTKEALWEYQKTSSLNLNVVLQENKGKLAARNAGMKAASYDWICWLDDDDAYIPTYLEAFNNAINQFPEYKVFNCAFYQLDLPNFTHRHWDAFVPEVKDGKCLPFKSGQVTTGSFIFKRELIDEVGYLPETKIAYGSEDSFAHLACEKWSGIKELYGQDKEGQWLPFGNPFGDDWAYFFALTRNNLPKAINVPLYLQYKKP